MPQSASISLGLILLVGGGPAFRGDPMSGSLSSELSISLTGALPNEVRYRNIGGAVNAAAGVFLLVKRRQTQDPQRVHFWHLAHGTAGATVLEMGPEVVMRALRKGLCKLSPELP